VFLISRSIYQRGLERTRFITKPYEDMVRDLPNELATAMGLDFDNAINEIKNIEIKV